MEIEGINFDLKLGYKPVTKLALKWIELSGGSFIASDRTNINDHYSTNIQTIDSHSKVYEIEEKINEFKNGEFTVICGEGEEIFGANVSILNPLVVRLESKVVVSRVNFTQSSISLKLHLAAPSLFGVPNINVLLYPWSYKSGREYERTVNKTMFREIYTSDRGYNTPIFEASFELTTDEMKQARAFIRDLRGSSIVWPDLKELNIFGDNVPGPHNIKIISWVDGGRKDLKFWDLKLRIVKDQ